MRDHVDIAGHALDFVAMNALRAREIAKHECELGIVERLHLVGEQTIALDRIGLDLPGDREQVGEIFDGRPVARLARFRWDAVAIV
jgi:hypothetical protein